MQATHGSASVRSRGRLIGCCMALALALSAVIFAPAASASEPPPPVNYLALGADNSFGYTQEKFETHVAQGEPVSAFEEGFASDVYAQMKTKGLAALGFKGKGLKLQNDGCPGETTDSLLTTAFGGEGTTHSPLEDAVKWPGPYGNPCFYHNKFAEATGKFPPGFHFPLHHEYGVAEEPQIKNALKVLAENAGKSEPTKVVTIDVGGNDELATVKACEREIRAEFEATGGFPVGGESKYNQENPEGSGKHPGTVDEALIGCAIAFAGPTIEKIIHNMGATAAIVHNFGGYEGKIVLLGFFNPFTFVLPGSDELQTILNSKIETQLLPAMAAGCYGSIKTPAECAEVQKAEKPGEPPVILKFANPFPKINGTKKLNKYPGTKAEKEAAQQAEEKEKICKYTEMCNSHDIAANNAKEVAEGKTAHNIGDIHPTPLGYRELATLAVKAYKCAGVCSVH